MAVAHDEAYLYLLLENDEADWRLADEQVLVGVELFREGGRTMDVASGHTFAVHPQTLIVLGRDAEVRLRAAYDPFTWRYGAGSGDVPFESAWADPADPTTVPFRQPLGHPLHLPASGRTIPFEFQTTGRLRHAPSHPADAPPDILADWYHEGRVLEVRIPWMFLGFTDPSSRQVWDWPHAAEAIVPRPIDGLRLEVVAPTSGEGAGSVISYTWPTWDTVTYHERPKALYDALREAYRDE